MIKTISALKTWPNKIKQFVKKMPERTVQQVKNANYATEDKLSYVRFAEKGDSIDPFTSEHFDYLRYLGVRD